MSRRHYVNNAAVVQTTTSLTSGATTVPVSDASSFPSSFPWTAVISAGQADAEVVLVTAAAANTLTVTRGYDGTAAQAHASNVTFAHVAVKADYDEANSHVNASSGVHGVTGSVVGTTDTQDLTNKTVVQNLVQITDWNTATSQGLYYHGVTTATNSPTAGLAYTGVVYAGSTGQLVQKVFRTTSVNTANEEWQRIFDGSAWGPWVQSVGDTGWLTSTSAFAPSAGHTVSAASYRRFGDVVTLSVTCTVPTMTPNSTGAIVATTVFTVTDARFIPTDGGQILHAYNPQLAEFVIDRFGVVQCRLSVPSLTIANNTSFTIAGTYLI